MRAEWARAAAERDAAWHREAASSAPNDNVCEVCGRPVSRSATKCNACARDGGGIAAARAAVERDGDQDRSPTASARTDAERDGAAEQSATQRRRLRYLGAAAAALAITVGVLAVVLGGEDPAPAAARVPVAHVPLAAEPPPVPESPEVRLAKAASFEEAIALARPVLVDTTDQLGEGARLLASYATAKLRWAEVDVPAETTLGHIEKDPERERGKRLCATGEILQIVRRDVGGRKVHVGRLRTADSDEVTFVAVGTTGELVKRSTGRLCGAALGMSGTAVSILGMFDFEENRLPLVEH